MAKSSTRSTARRKSPSSTKRSRSTSTKKGAVSERSRKKQIRTWRRYATTLAIIFLCGITIIGYERRFDQQMADWVHGLWLDSTASAGFTFRELIVEGRRLTDSNLVIQAVGLEIGDSLFMVSLHDIRQRLLTIDSVQDASVSRDLNGRIIITIQEREPFALWQHQNRLHVIDREGVVLSRESPDQYGFLVTVAGEQAPAHMEELSSFIALDKELAENVVAAVFVSNRRWDIHFNNGIQILLPESQPDAAWEYLAKLHREHDILQQQVDAIDLRIDDRVFITLPEENNATTQAASDV